MKIKLTIDKQAVEMEMDEEATLEDLKNAVAESKEVPATKIRFILRAKILTKNEKLKDLNIKPTDIFIVSIRKVSIIRSQSRMKSQNQSKKKRFHQRR